MKKHLVENDMSKPKKSDTTPTTTLTLDFENCYGIKSLRHEFKFSTKHSTFSIYASNGSMKTSFAKVFEEISEERDPEDSVYPQRKSKFDIKLDKNDIGPSQIFVIRSYKQDYESGKLSTLMVNKKLRSKYGKIHKDIDDKKQELLKKLKEISGVKQLDEIEKSISRTFYQNEENKFFETLERIKTEINGDKIIAYPNIEYKIIFNDKVKNFLNQPDIQQNIKEYIEKYDELLEQSTYFKKGIFDHSQAEVIASQLKKNGFFEAQHAVLFGAEKISTEEQLQAVINQEKEKILSDKALRNKFNVVDAKIKANADLREFRDFLANHLTIAVELNNLDSFSAKLWKYYLHENKADFNDLLNIHSQGDGDLRKIVAEAQKEQTKWLDVLQIFNERFTVPFTVKIANKTDVMLKDDVPTTDFEFVENNETRNMEKDELLKILSQGEKRALYLLDIIFEIEARKDEDEKNLFVIDDIADSFDYQNKYAIIEYLSDISKENNFYQIILSHNFDFHRTISSRLSMGRPNKLNVVKNDDGITLTEEVYQNNPFNDWRKNLNNDHKLIASIPFVRNLAEYSGNDDIKNKLTACLHYKTETETLTLQDINDYFKQILCGINLTKNLDRKYLDFLNDVVNEPVNKELLEYKIVMAISIRLKSEKFMIDHIDDKNFVNSIKENQTRELVGEYKKLCKDVGEDAGKNIKNLDKVQLMTPESIHINSFMYEPLLDMSNTCLINLHSDIIEMCKSTK